MEHFAPKGNRWHNGSVFARRDASLESRYRVAAYTQGLLAIHHEDVFPPHALVSDRTKKYLALLAEARHTGGIDAINEIFKVLQVSHEDIATYRSALIRGRWATVKDAISALWRAIRGRE